MTEKKIESILAEQVISTLLDKTSIEFGDKEKKSIRELVVLLKDIRNNDDVIKAVCGTLAMKKKRKKNKDEVEKCKNVFRKLISDPPTNVNKVEELIKRIDEALNNATDGRSGAGGGGSCGNYVTLLEALKNLVRNKAIIDDYCKEKHENNKNEIKNCNERLNDIVNWPIIDTCYDEDRAKKLKNGLEGLKDMDSECILVRLLLASYIGMLSNNDNVFERVEWVPLLLRAAVRSRVSNSKDVYIPVCPGRGDVAAVAYYLALCCGS